MSGGNLQSKITYLTNHNKRFCGEIHASTLVDAKVKAGGSIYIYVQDKSIKKHCLRERS
jgi:hypothetical protein